MGLSEMIYCFDIDGTICSSVKNSDYENAKPFKKIINHINDLYESGNEIIIMSARGSVSKIDYYEFTKKQLGHWGLKYHKLLMNIKPNADLFVDDKAIHIEEYKKRITPITGFIAGCFDVVHPGYIHLFKQAKRFCDFLIVGLHEDPSIERQEKIKPILSIEEREEILLSLKYIDKVIAYKTETDLYNFLKNNKIDIRFLGSDYKDKNYTGKDLNVNIHFIDRDHGWSSTKFKTKIKESIV